MQLRGDRFQRIGRLEEENPFINDEQRVSSHLHMQKVNSIYMTRYAKS